jgi:hypothetical protein
MDQLVAFLQSAKRLYPFGVPKSLIESLGAEQSGVESSHKNSKLLLLTPKLSASARALIMAAMEKGLKTSNYEILEFTDQLADQITAKITKYAAVINFDAIDAFKNERHESGVLIVQALNPESVVNDAALKKEFWNQIQKVIPEMNR